MMNDEHCEFPELTDLGDKLRNVAIPPDLKNSLLSLAEETDKLPALAQSEITKLSSRNFARTKHMWGVRWEILTTAALLIVALIGWRWRTTIDNSPYGDSVEQLAIDAGVAEANSAETPAEPEAATSAAETLETLAELKREWKELQEEALAVEISHRMWELRQLLKPEPQNAYFTKQEIIPQTIVSQVDTAWITGYRSESLKTQLEYVIAKFPQSTSVAEAQRLLAQF